MSSPNFSSSSTDISSSSAPLSRADLVNRIEYLLSGGLQLGALVLLSLPLCGHFCRRQWLALKDGLAGSLLLYQLAQVGFLLPSLLYNCYMLWAWLGLGARFSVPAMFWLGLWSPAGMASISSATFFLTLDRCCVLLWPFSYPKRRGQHWALTVSAAVTIGLFLAVVAQTLLLELPLDEGKASYCLNHPCVATHQHYKYQMFIYTGQSVVNLAMSVLFLVLLRRQQKFAVTQTQQQQQQPGAINGSKISWLRNRIVVITVCLEVCFKILPGLACTLVNNFTTILMSDYLGWYILLFTSLDSFAISAYFALVLLKRPPKAFFLCCFGLGAKENCNSTKATMTLPQKQQIKKKSILRNSDQQPPILVNKRSVTIIR